MQIQSMRHLLDKWEGHGGADGIGDQGGNGESPRAHTAPCHSPTAFLQMQKLRQREVQ